MTAKDPEKAGHGALWHSSIIDAWGVEPKAGPAGRIGDSRCMKERKIDAGEPGGSEPLRRLSGRPCGAHCARQCRTKCTAGSAGALVTSDRARDVERAVRRDRRGGSRCTHAKHGAAARDRDGDHERRRMAMVSRAKQAAGDAERSKATSAARSEREVTVPPQHRLRESNGPRPKRKMNGPRHRE